MPLPNTWHGFFYSSETAGDLIVDLAPRDFVAFLLERASEQNPPFLTAGAIFDLILNATDGDDFKKRSEELLAIGQETWPEFQWDKVTRMAGDVEKFRETGVPERQIINLSYAVLTTLFKDTGIPV